MCKIGGINPSQGQEESDRCLVHITTLPPRLSVCLPLLSVPPSGSGVHVGLVSLLSPRKQTVCVSRVGLVHVDCCLGERLSVWQPQHVLPENLSEVLCSRTQAEHHSGERLPALALLPARPELPAAGCGPLSRVLHWRHVCCAVQRCPHSRGEVGWR